MLATTGCGIAHASRSYAQFCTVHACIQLSQGKFPSPNGACAPTSPSGTPGGASRAVARLLVVRTSSTPVLTLQLVARTSRTAPCVPDQQRRQYSRIARRVLRIVVPVPAPTRTRAALPGPLWMRDAAGRSQFSGEICRSVPLVGCLESLLPPSDAAGVAAGGTRRWMGWYGATSVKLSADRAAAVSIQRHTGRPLNTLTHCQTAHLLASASS